MAHQTRACERVRHLTRHLGATDDERDAIERNPTAAGENPARTPPRSRPREKGPRERAFLSRGSQTTKMPPPPPRLTARPSRLYPSRRRGPEDPARPRWRRRLPDRHRQPHRQEVRATSHRGRLRVRDRVQGHQSRRRRKRAQALRPRVHEHRAVQEQNILHRRR